MKNQSVYLNNPSECQPCVICGMIPNNMDVPCMEINCPSKP